MVVESGAVLLGKVGPSLLCLVEATPGEPLARPSHPSLIYLNIIALA